MIEVRNLHRYYGDFAAISDLSFDIAQHEIIGFLGLNGAGKSTTLKILAGLLSPSSGDIIIDGINWIEHPKHFRSNIGFLPEEPPLYKDMTVTEFLVYLAKLRHYKGNISERLPKVLQICQLTNRAHQVISELSLGYRKRVGIAQAIVHEPKLVILDEPSSGLDPQQMLELRQVIRNLSKEATVLLSSHNLTEVAETCDRLLILNNGKLVAQGNQESLSHIIDGQNNSIDCLISSSEDHIRNTIRTVLDDDKYLLQPEGEVWSLQAHLPCTVPEFVKILVQADIAIYQITPKSSELENIFLSLTGGAQ